MTASRSTLANAFTSLREAFARRSPDRWEQRLSGLEQRLDEVNAKLSSDPSLTDVRADLTHLNALAQRLDADVVAGFAQVAQRLQKDLVILSNVTHQNSELASDVSSRIRTLQFQLAGAASSTPLSINLDFPNSIKGAYPDEFDAAWQATNDVLETLQGIDFSKLTTHSPGLEGFDWVQYIRLSAIRLVRIGSVLRKHLPKGARILDFGSYFGNSALFLRYSGYDVDAADNYESYGTSFGKSLDLLREAGIRVINLGREDRSLNGLEDCHYDACTCLGVIEHIPNTPKQLLLRLDRTLKPGGLLVVDTPNLLYLHNRERFAAGESIFSPIQHQFHAPPPFEGHHREFSPSEVEWMLKAIGHTLVHRELFNYSIYGHDELKGSEADRFRQMEASPELRESILACSVKPSGAS